jgi:hypothetical protein
MISQNQKKISNKKINELQDNLNQVKAQLNDKDNIIKSLNESLTKLEKELIALRLKEIEQIKKYKLDNNNDNNKIDQGTANPELESNQHEQNEEEFEDEEQN